MESLRKFKIIFTSINKISFYSTSYPIKPLQKMKSTSMFSSTCMSNVNNPRLLGISQFQSSNSLQNSTSSWTFTKANRFSHGNYKRNLTDSIYSLPEFKNRRYTTQGLGGRKDLRPRVGSCSPPPDTYNIKTCFDVNIQKRKGMSLLQKVPALVS
jgi:hypothetical protein